LDWSLAFGLESLTDESIKGLRPKHKAQKSNSDCMASLTRKRECLLLE
jgi:hypothetical protein